MADHVAAGGARRLRDRLGSVRARATLAAVMVVGVATMAGALGLLSLLRASMTEGVETTAEAQVNGVVSLLRLGQLPPELPAGRGDSVTQVVGSNGRVLATSATVLGAQPITRLRPGEDGIVLARLPIISERDAGSDRRPAGDREGPYLVVAQSVAASPIAGAAGPPVTVYVALSLRPVAEATGILGLALACGLPLLVALVGALVWIFGGRALRPVESIRAEVADITGRDLHRRVPEPASTDEVARLARTMNGMLDRLEAAATAQRRFVADASHELRSPLAALEATLEVALVHPGETRWPAVTASALDEARRLQRLVDDLLVLARTDGAASVGAPTRRVDSVDLDEIVLVEGHRRRATSPVPIDLHKVSAGRVAGDADQLARAVGNLLDNAQRHAASGVSVELFTNGRLVVLNVSDDGPGIPAGDHHRIFERFARLDEARSQYDGGTGLGLAITKDTVEAHGGTIEVADSPIGARLCLTLPALEPVVAEQ